MATADGPRSVLSNQTNLLYRKYYRTQTCTAPIRDEPAYVGECVSDVARYLFEAELVQHQERLYMDRQSEITDRMRKIVVDWLLDVLIEFKLHPETFFLAVDILDRYLFFYSIPRGKLQLVGITSFLIAAKHEEVWPPSVNECVAVTANTYTSKEVVSMEYDIVTALRFKFSVPTTFSIACCFLQQFNASQSTREATFLFLESAAHCYPLLRFLPSRIAAAAFLLGTKLDYSNNNERNVSTPKLWQGEFFRVSCGFLLEEVHPVAEQLLHFTKRLCSGSSRLQALHRKYSGKEFNAVTTLQI